MKYDLIHLLAMKLIWPRGSSRAAFPTELHLDNAILKTLEAELQARDPDPDEAERLRHQRVLEANSFCKHCGVWSPVFRNGRCVDCGEPSP